MCCCFDSNLWNYYHITLCIFISMCFMVGSAFNFNIYCSRIWIVRLQKVKKKYRRKYFFVKNILLSSALCTEVFFLLYFALRAWPEVLKSRTCMYLKFMLIWMENVGAGIAQMVSSVPLPCKGKRPLFWTGAAATVTKKDGGTKWWLFSIKQTVNFHQPWMKNHFAKLV